MTASPANAEPEPWPVAAAEGRWPFPWKQLGRVGQGPWIDEALPGLGGRVVRRSGAALVDWSRYHSAEFDPQRIDPLILEFFRQPEAFNIVARTRSGRVRPLLLAYSTFLSGPARQMDPNLGLTDVARAQSSLLSDVVLEGRAARVWQRWWHTRDGRRDPFYTAVAEDALIIGLPSGDGVATPERALVFSMPWPGGNYVVAAFSPRNAPDGGIVVSTARTRPGTLLIAPRIGSAVGVPTTESLHFQADEAGGRPFLRVLHTNEMLGRSTFEIHYVMWRPSDFGRRRPDVELRWPGSADRRSTRDERKARWEMVKPTAENKSEPFSVAEFSAAYLRAWNTHDEEGVPALLTPDVVYTDSSWPKPMHGHEEVRAFLRHAWRAFPDMRFELLDGPYLMGPDKAAFWWRGTGTMTGVLDPPGFAPTHKAWHLEGADFHEYRDGRICRLRIVFNLAEASQQIGLMPGPGSVGERVGVALQRLGARVRRPDRSRQAPAPRTGE